MLLVEVKLAAGCQTQIERLDATVGMTFPRQLGLLQSSPAPAAAVQMSVAEQRVSNPGDRRNRCFRSMVLPRRTKDFCASERN